MQKELELLIGDFAREGTTTEEKIQEVTAMISNEHDCIRRAVTEDDITCHAENITLLKNFLDYLRIERQKENATFGIAVYERDTQSGLTKDEYIRLFDMLGADDAYPLEIEETDGSGMVMGFITPEAAEILDFDYMESGLADYISSICREMSEQTEYAFKGIRIFCE